MREIKLKVVTISNVDNCLIEISEPMSVKKVGDYIAERIDKDCVERYEYIQFTGLKDKNGKEIYEGDIVTGCYHNLSVDYSNKGVVEMGETYDSDGWATEKTYGWISKHDDDDTSSLLDLVEHNGCEVIGNIYENPELLTNN